MKVHLYLLLWMSECFRLIMDIVQQSPNLTRLKSQIIDNSSNIHEHSQFWKGWVTSQRCLLLRIVFEVA